MHSIHFKITIITIAAILTSVTAAIIACFLTIRTENKKNMTIQANLLCDNTKDMLDDYFDSIEQSVEMEASLATDTMNPIMLVNSGLVDGAGQMQTGRTPEQVAMLDDYLKGYCKNLQEVFGSVAGRAQGTVTYYYCINPEVSVREHGFFYSKIGKSGFVEQDPLDARELDSVDLNHYSWYYAPIYRGHPIWVGPYSAHFLEEMLTVSYVAPIYKAGVLIGVLGMDIPFDTIVSQISPIRLYKTGFACLLDENGRVLYHPEFKYGDKMVLDDESVLETILTDSNSGEEPIRYTAHGEERQMSFATLNNGMKLVIVIPTKEIYSSWTQLTHAIMLSTFIILILFVVITYFAMRIIIRPLQQLTSASQKLAAGDYDLELAYSGNDEVGVLTEAFRQMRDHLKQYIKDLNKRIYTDELTGLPNRNYFAQLAETARISITEEGKEPVLVYFNLIGIKYYNRQYTYAEGNRLICEVADNLVRHFGWERCSHFGEGRYAVVTDEEDFKARIHGIFEECEKANKGNGVPVRVGVYPYSMGNVEVGIACDRAKFASDKRKDSYLSNYNYYDTDMQVRIQISRHIINNLDRALEEGWIQVYYQPIMCAKKETLCDEEALARWFDPIRGMISPGEFVPVLEMCKLIYKLDLYVLDQIIQKMKEQKEAGLPVIPHSLNLSRIDFDECDIIDEILKRVDRAGIPRDKLNIEITESVVGSDFEFIRKQIERLQDLGFHVWMDDFGSGYSSLDVLQDIHFDLIKFDMRFMHRFGKGRENRIILTQLFKMATELGTDTIAEGVETREQVEFLKEVGCTRLQGFYYSRAIPAEEIKEKYEMIVLDRLKEID